MRPVMMTKFGYDENGEDQGDCLTACVASLLECDVNSLPDFSSMGRHWHHFTVEYLRSRGLTTVFIPVESLAQLIVLDCQCICIFETRSPEFHAVIGRWNSEWDAEENSWRYSIHPEFDPNPNGVEITEPHAVFLVMGPIPSTSGYGAKP